jgi:hypothetical protein
MAIPFFLNNNLKTNILPLTRAGFEILGPEARLEKGPSKILNNEF